ncbi:MAG: ABC transporter ATP-binding protein [Candidatus Melainabacteria bacterium]|nr:ABC transporter ATP-binding protein [Candidatus Melainabacteria bacterium]
MNTAISPENPDAASHSDSDLDCTAFVLVADQLQKQFQPSGQPAFMALNGVSFSVPKGCVFCILGPNGAGKTTLIRILTTITRASGGRARVLGLDLEKQSVAIRQQLGVLFQENHYNRYLSLWQNLELHAQLHGLSPKQYKPRAEALLQAVGLYPRRHDPIDQLSGGMQRKFALVRALLHSPSLLFLDEPTTGLDPQARREVWQTIETLRQQNTTIILTTHYLEEADRLSDRILMLKNGSVVAEGTPTQLKQAISKQNSYRILLRTPLATHYSQLFAERLAPQSDHRFQVMDDYTLHLHGPAPGTFWDLVSQVASQDLRHAGLDEADLEAVFMAMAGQQDAASFDKAATFNALSSVVKNASVVDNGSARNNHLPEAER